MELIDRVSLLQKETKQGFVSAEAISRELTRITRMIGVNLNYGSSPLNSLAEIRELVNEYHSYLENAYNSKNISRQVFRQNLESLLKVLQSCTTLPKTFLIDMVTKIEKSLDS